MHEVASSPFWHNKPSLFWEGGVVLLAATAQNRCTALVYSCYVPSRNLGTRVEGTNTKKQRSGVGKNVKDGVIEEVGSNDDELQLGHERVIHGGNYSNSGTIGPNIQLIPTLKSNLKKTNTIVDDEEKQQVKTERRKVSWPDAHGRDIAHVQEFEPSVSSDDGELEGVRNSCVCAIQ